MTISSSAVSAISDSRWLDTSTVRPSSASRCMKVRIQTMPSGSRPLTGSSNSSISGSPSRAPAMPSRCDIPSEKAPARLPATAVRPTISRTSSTGPSGACSMRPSSAGAHGRSGSGAPTWRRAARRPCAAAAAGRGSACHRSVTLPPVGVSRPRIIRMVVDLPAPFGPRKPVTSPGSTSNDSWFTAMVLPNFLVSSTASIMTSSVVVAWVVSLSPTGAVVLRLPVSSCRPVAVRGQLFVGCVRTASRTRPSGSVPVHPDWTLKAP